MKYVRIKSVLNGKLLADHAYFGNDHCKALERFRREYPEHGECVLIAETIDDDDHKYTEWFKAARNCDCVHTF